MITYNWTIVGLDRRSEDEFVTNAHWQCTAVDGEFLSSVYGEVKFSEGVPTIPYTELTKEQVLEWCWANGVNKSTIETNMNSQIELLKNPVQKSGLPW